MRDVVKAARDAGATSIWANVLYLRPGTREHFMACLASDWPELLPRYRRLYAGRAYLDKTMVGAVKGEVRDLAAIHGIADRRDRPIMPLPDPEPPVLAEQLPLIAFIQADGPRALAAARPAG